MYISLTANNGFLQLLVFTFSAYGPNLNWVPGIEISEHMYEFVNVNQLHIFFSEAGKSSI